MNHFVSVLSSKLLLILIALMSLESGNVRAQQIDWNIARSYYIANDANGIQQVFQTLLDETQETLQLTHAEKNVLTFGVDYDGLDIAYFSDGQLWLQTLYNDQDAEALATVNAYQYLRSPVFSLDSRYLAYADNGVWVLDIATRESRLLIQDVTSPEDAASPEDYGIYAPERFIRGNDGSMSHLVLDITSHDWNTAGIYDLQSGELQMVEDVSYTSLLPLYGGRVLIYGNNQSDGEPKLYVAVDVNDINSYSEVLDFSSLVENAILFAHQAIEIAPGTVRVVGTTMEGENLATTEGFYFDYNLMTGEVLAVSKFQLPVSESSERLIGFMSPDGRLLPILVEIAWDESQQLFGDAEIIDPATGEPLFSISRVSELLWRP